MAWTGVDPALWVFGIEIPICSFGNRRTSSAPGEESAFRTFAELIKLTVRLHTSYPYIRQFIFIHITYSAVRYPSAGIDIAGRQNCEMTVSAMAAVIDYSFLGSFRYMKFTGFIVMQSP